MPARETGCRRGLPPPLGRAVSALRKADAERLTRLTRSSRTGFRATAPVEIRSRAQFLEAVLTRSPVHHRVHKADFEPENGQSLDCVAVERTVIQPNDEQ